MRETLPAGTTVSHYRITSRIGAGGMGEVYLAQDTKLGRTVALKIPPVDVAGDRKRMQRFVQEAKSASALSHPNVCVIHEVGEGEDGHPFIAMEYVEGQALSAKIGGGSIPTVDVINIGIEVADALHEAHSKGITHRDIKPGNIMITPRGQVKVLDFGLAKVTRARQQAAAGEVSTEANTEPGVVMGTVPYMSPEQAMGQEVDHRTDIFSLGVVLYEMATGTRPFRGNTVAAVYDAILNREPVPALSLIPELPSELERIITKALEKGVDVRYQSVNDLLVDLRRLKRDIDSGRVSARSLAAASVTDSEVHRRRQRRLYGRVAGAAAGIILVVLLLWALSGQNAVEKWLGRGEVPPQKHLAVLPFTNVGNDPKAQAFCDGLVEVLASKITQLEQFHGSLWVVPISDVRQRHVASVGDARREFGVTLVVTGGMVREGDNVRLTLNLVDAKTLRQLRSFVIDEQMPNASAFYEGTVVKLAEMLEVELKPQSIRVLRAGGTTVPGAWEFYLSGRGNLQRYDRPENIDSAIGLFERALNEDPRYALAYAGLGEAYWQKYKVGKDAQLVEQAVKNCKQALELDDQLPPVHVTLGVIHTGTGKYEEAVQDFQRALALDPHNADAHRGLAEAYESLGQLQKAESTYQKAVDLRPSYWAGHNALGVFYWRHGNYAQAELQFLKVIECTPDNHRGYSNLGALYHLWGRFTEAAQMLEKSLAIKPTPEGYSNLGVVYYYQGRYDDAVTTMERSIGLGWADYKLWGNLGDAYRQTPQIKEKAADAYKKAIDLARQQLEINPRDAALRASMAVYWAKLGNKKNALAQIEEALRLAPNNVNVLFRSVLAYELSGKRDRALVELEATLKGGYSIDEVRKAPHLAELRKDPRFEQLVARISSSRPGSRTPSH